MATNWDAILSNTNSIADILMILRKVLAGLEGKVDLTVINEALLEIEQVKTDVADEIEYFNKVINESVESGLYVPFNTQAELLAYVPDAEPVVGKAFDTRKVWLWETRTPATTPSWHDTGLSELDQAKEDATYKANTAENNANKFASNAALNATANLNKTNAANLFDFPDLNGDIPASLNSAGEFEAQDFKNEHGSFNVIAQSINRKNISEFTHIDQDADGNILFAIRRDGSFVCANPSLKYGISELRADAVPTEEIQALGIRIWSIE